MSKKIQSSLPTLTVAQLQPIHDSLLAFTGGMGSWKQESERARQRAFRVRSCPRLFKYWYLRSQVLKRFQGGKGHAESRRCAAFQLVLDLEAQTKVHNQRLVDGWGKPWPEPTRKLLKRAQRIIAEILGPFNLDELPDWCDFSSGATTEHRRGRSSVQNKWEVASHVTKKALPYAVAFAKWAGTNQPLTWCDEASGIFYQSSRREQRFTVVPGNVVFTVPKRFDIDRPCAKEPSWNVFLQKGLGAMIRSRLQRVGLLQPDAQEYHGRLSRESSATGRLATSDLSGASESVSCALVELLLPKPWVDVLMDIRSPTGEIPGVGQITYEKISSMGNGNTFELETLIFYALAAACCKEGDEVSVYGDDLIYPAEHHKTVAHLFEFCGFQFNYEKSFAEGPFRESCGDHSWDGVDVKPFYVDNLPVTLSQVINLHNDIVRWMDDWPVTRLIEICRQIRRIVPKKFWGPFGVAGCLWAEWDEATPRFVSNRRNKKQPSYDHWRVATVRREVVVQTHDYYRGSLFAEYWAQHKRTVRGPGPGVKPWFYERGRLVETSLNIKRRLDPPASFSDFTFALTRDVKGWVAVGVASDWPRLRVRLALPLA